MEREFRISFRGKLERSFNDVATGRVSWCLMIGKHFIRSSCRSNRRQSDYFVLPRHKKIIELVLSESFFVFVFWKAFLSIRLVVSENDEHLFLWKHPRRSPRCGHLSTNRELSQELWTCFDGARCVSWIRNQLSDRYIRFSFDSVLLIATFRKIISRWKNIDRCWDSWTWYGVAVWKWYRSSWSNSTIIRCWLWNCACNNLKQAGSLFISTFKRISFVVFSLYIRFRIDSFFWFQFS